MFKMLKVIGKTLFGGGGAASDGLTFVQEATKGIGTFIDEQKFTDEERSQASAKAASQMIEMIKATRDENSPRHVTQRYLAWGIMGAFVFLILLSAAVWPFSPDYSAMLFTLASKSVMGELAMGVGAFFFLAGVVRNVRK